MRTASGVVLECNTKTTSWDNELPNVHNNWDFTPKLVDWLNVTSANVRKNTFLILTQYTDPDLIYVEFAVTDTVCGVRSLFNRLSA